MNNMSTKVRPANRPGIQNAQQLPPITSVLDIMKDGREYESVVVGVAGRNINFDVTAELKRAVSEIEKIRKRPLLCYMANVVNNTFQAPISIDEKDDLPFKEMISTIPAEIKDIDLLIVTSGGSGNQVAKFVDRLRPRFESVNFVIPNIAMSAGTILAMSGDNIIMTNSSYIGPIDPQVPNQEGRYVAAQSITTLIEEIQKRGEINLKKGMAPDWTDLEILRRIDPKDIGAAENASRFSEELVENYLYNYKFKYWLTHSTTGEDVTDEERKQRAKEISKDLCRHSLWKSHARGITRDDAWKLLKLRITPAEETEGLDRAIARLWALMYYVFENSPVYKVFFAQDYSLVRNLNIQQKP